MRKILQDKRHLMQSKEDFEDFVEGFNSAPRLRGYPDLKWHHLTQKEKLKSIRSYGFTWSESWHFLIKMGELTGEQTIDAILAEPIPVG